MFIGFVRCHQLWAFVSNDYVITQTVCHWHCKVSSCCACVRILHSLDVMCSMLDPLNCSVFMVCIVLCCQCNLQFYFADNEITSVNFYLFYQNFQGFSTVQNNLKYVKRFSLKGWQLKSVKNTVILFCLRTQFKEVWYKMVFHLICFDKLHFD